MTTQGVPDDLKPDRELPLDAVVALRSIALRLRTLNDAIRDMIRAIDDCADAINVSRDTER
jgi:hypothetical protein